MKELDERVSRKVCENVKELKRVRRELEGVTSPAVSFLRELNLLCGFLEVR